MGPQLGIGREIRCRVTRVNGFHESRKPGNKFKVGRQKVADLLTDLGYSLQANRKTKEGTSHPDRKAPFAYINAQVAAFQKRGQPVVSVDTQKKALVGDCKNAGRAWRPQGAPALVRISDMAAVACSLDMRWACHHAPGNQR